MFGAMKLKLYHQAGSDSLDSFVDQGDSVPFFKWQTCLRSLVLAPNDFKEERLQGGGEWLEGESAYRRLLEIACGLHSPLIGETEVFGQFKEAVQARIQLAEKSARRGTVDVLEVAFAATLRQWSKALIEDVKLVRQKHLLDLGSQSYGSLVRREVRGLRKPHIEFLGSGQLANEILPWLLKALKSDDGGVPSVIVHSRNVEKSRARLQATTKEAIRFFDLSQGPLNLLDDETSAETLTIGRMPRVLIIAAPMTSVEIASWARNLVHYDLVIDLRGESRHDSLASIGLTSRLRALEEVFSAIELAKEVAGVRKSEALTFIEQRVEVRGATALHRPFGWDDVWS